MTYSGKRTLITGASSGIGRETAYRFARAGSDLVLVARTTEQLQHIAHEIGEQHRVDVDIVGIDIADAAECFRALEKYVEAKPVNVAIINHGIGQYGRFALAQWNELEPVLQTNLVGGAAVARAVLPPMLTAGAGSIVFISTILDKRPIPNHAVYSASKSGLRTLANVLRMESKGSGVHIGVVSPSRTTTDFSKRVLYSEPPSPSVVNIASPPSRAAEAIFKCVSGKRREITVSFTGKAYTFAGYHFPRLADWFITRIVPKPGASGDE